MRAYLRHLLQGRYNVVTVDDGQTALEAARSSVPDLVVSDIMMPGLDGFALLRALRGDPKTNLVPVVLLSARAGEEARIDGLKSGADDYLVKPFSSRELLARLDACLELAQRHPAQGAGRHRRHGRERGAAAPLVARTPRCHRPGADRAGARPEGREGCHR
jgi:DNA-binding response OmpR family regulator